jgi:pimeloyl-ACP methyl ester carboxylesterase
MSSTNGDKTPTGATGTSVPVNGLSLYYEEHGARNGEPLIVLHGGVGGLEMFGPNLPLLAAARRVIAVHLQGHGRTADIDRPLRYELLADDIAALLAHLGIPSADLLGYSFGAGVALQTASVTPNWCVNWSLCPGRTSATAGIPRCGRASTRWDRRPAAS